MIRNRVRRYSQKLTITPDIINKCLNSESLFEVSRRSGVNKSTISYRKEKLGFSDIPVKNLTFSQMALLLQPKERKPAPKRVRVSEEMIEAYKSGLSAQEVSETFGVSASTLTRRFREIGIIRTSKEAFEIAYVTGKHVTARQAFR